MKDLICKINSAFDEIFDYEFWDNMKKMLPIILTPFLGILFVISIGEFTIGETTYPKFTWLWISIAFMYGMVFQLWRKNVS